MDKRVIKLPRKITYGRKGAREERERKERRKGKVHKRNVEESMENRKVTTG